MPTNIKSYNDKGQPHGYREEYYANGQLMLKGTFVNGIRIGQWEFYYATGHLASKRFYAN